MNVAAQFIHFIQRPDHFTEPSYLLNKGGLVLDLEDPEASSSDRTDSHLDW